MRINEDFIDNIESDDLITKDNTVTEPVEYKYRILMICPYFINDFYGKFDQHMNVFHDCAKFADNIMKRFPFISEHQVEIVFNLQDEDITKEFEPLGGRYKLTQVPSYRCQMDHFYTVVHFNFSQAPSYMQLLGMFSMLFKVNSPAGNRTKMFRMMTKIKRGYANTNMVSLDASHIEYIHQSDRIAMNMWQNDIKNFLQEFYPRDTFASFIKNIGLYHEYQKSSINIFIPKTSSDNFKTTKNIKRNCELSRLSAEEIESLSRSIIYCFDPGCYSGCYFIDNSEHTYKEPMYTQDKRMYELTSEQFLDIVKDFIKNKAKTVDAYTYKYNGFKCIALFFNTPLIMPDYMNNLEYGLYARILY